MNGYDIFETIGEIDGRFVEQTAAYKRRIKARRRTGITAAAACLILAVSLTAAAVLKSGSDAPLAYVGQSGSSSRTDASAEITSSYGTTAKHGAKSENAVQDPVTGANGKSNSAASNESTSAKTGESTTNAPKSGADTVENATVSSTKNSSNSACEIIVEKKWNEKKIYEKYTSIARNGVEFDSMFSDIDSRYIGSKIGNAESRGYDTYSEKSYTKGAEIYEIKGVDPDCAFAVKYDGEEGYWIFRYAFYDFKTLGEFKSKLNLKEYTEINRATREYMKDGKAVVDYYTVSDPGAVWSRLLDDDSIKNEGDYAWADNTGKLLLNLSVSIPTLGQKNISIQVYQAGYVHTNIFGTRKIFYVGKEKAHAFAEYMINSGTLYNSQTVEVYNAPKYDTTVTVATSSAAVPE